MRVKPLAWLLQTIKIETDECIIWPFMKNKKGYGGIFYNGKQVNVSRVVLHLHNGFDLASPLLVMHSCDNPPCVNKRHLSPGTDAQNRHSASSKGRLPGQEKTRCIHGHTLDEYNTYIAPDGRRRCKTCRYKAVKRRLEREAAKKQLDSRI
jgi:hypothetical protein